MRPLAFLVGLREVEIDSLTVRHLKVIEEVAGEPNSAAS